jgi:hypothetical protein
MNHRLRNCLVAGVVGTALALAAPALARGGGHGGGFGGHGGGFGGMRGGGMHAMGGGMHFGGMGGARFGGARFAGAPVAHAGFAPRFSHAAFHRGFHHRFHHRRFAFVGAPYLYAGYYDGCWRRVWTGYGPRWVNLCSAYGYY